MSKYLLSFPFRFQFDAYVFLVSITIRSSKIGDWSWWQHVSQPSIFAQAVHAQEYLATRRFHRHQIHKPTLQVDSHGNNKICQNFDDLNSLIFRLMSFLWVQIQYLLVEFAYINCICLHIFVAWIWCNEFQAWLEGCFASTGVCRRERSQKREVHQRGERVKVRCSSDNRTLYMKQVCLWAMLTHNVSIFC